MKQITISNKKIQSEKFAECVLDLESSIMVPKLNGSTWATFMVRRPTYLHDMDEPSICMMVSIAVCWFHKSSNATFTEEA